MSAPSSARMAAATRSTSARAPAGMSASGMVRLLATGCVGARGSLRLPDRLLDGLRLVELGGELLAHGPAEGLLDEAAGLAALAAGEAPRLDLRLAGGRDDDADDLLHARPPTSISTTMDPSASDCSVAA